MGAEDLIDNGCSVAVISYHSGDTSTNANSSARLSYSGISSFPTAKFDGVLTHVGGSNTQSLYSTYLPMYNERIAILSSFTIDTYGYATGIWSEGLSCDLNHTPAQYTLSEENTVGFTEIENH